MVKFQALQKYHNFTNLVVNFNDLLNKNSSFGGMIMTYV